MFLAPVCLYQESIMEIVRKFGGRTYGGADKFRKGIGQKDVNLVQQESNLLYSEIINNGYDETIAKLISDEMKVKGGYAFNKSHSISYAVITLQTAYLKAHYPVEFYCAVFNACGNDNGKLNKYLVEAQELGIEVVPPHVNKSDDKFNVVEGKILFGLNYINEVGNKLIEEILSERQQNGKFASLDNFLERVKCSSLRVVMLIKAGALPTKNKSKLMLEYAQKYSQSDVAYKEYVDVKTLPTLLELKTKWNIDTDTIKDKQERLKLYNEKRRIEHDTNKYQEWLDNQKAKQEKQIAAFKEKYMDNEKFWEFEALSIFLSDNPFSDLTQYNTQNFYDCEMGEECVIIGIISKIHKKKDRNKNDYAFINVYESQGLLEGIAWSSVYSKHIDFVKKGNKLAFYSEKSNDNTFIIKKIKNVEEWLQDRELCGKISL